VATREDPTTASCHCREMCTEAACKAGAKRQAKRREQLLSVHDMHLQAPEAA